MVQTVIQLLAVLTLLSNLTLVVVIFFYLTSKQNKESDKYWKKITHYLDKKEIKLALVISLVATSGSLFLSEVAHFEPCKLCWLQRIFMYPLVLILAIALKEKSKDIFKYVIPLSVIGLVIAAYHYYFQVTGNALVPCSAVGFSVSCSERFFTYFGYITIPWMSLSAFGLITFLMYLLKSRKS